MLASADRLFGVNCGEDKKVGWVHNSLKEAMGTELKATVLDGVHGLTVYEDVGPVRFVRVEAAGVAMRQPEGMVAAFDCFFGENPKLNEEELTCLELVNASNFEPPRAAFLTLVTAAEVLCPQQPRPASYRKLVEDVKAMLDSNPAAEADRQSLKNELERLRPEQSIRSACKAMITSLLGGEAFKRFDELYGVRSRITHEGTKEEVAKWLPEARDIVWKLLLASIRSRDGHKGT
jgi:hypothetical protein